MRLIERIAGRISESSRAKKMAQFMELVRPQASEILLDVGVNATEYSENDNYLERNYPWPQQVTALGVGEDFTEFNRRYPLIKTVNGDGTSSWPFRVVRIWHHRTDSRVLCKLFLAFSRIHEAASLR